MLRIINQSPLSGQDEKLAQAVEKGSLVRAWYALHTGSHIKALYREDEENMTPLMRAVHSNKILLTAFLLSQGADSSAKNSYHVTPLMAAAEMGTIKITNLLLSHGAKAKETSLTGMTSLMLAAHQGHLNIIKLLLAKGADINAQDEDGRTASYYAGLTWGMEGQQKIISRKAQVLEFLNDLADEPQWTNYRRASVQESCLPNPHH